MRQPKEPLEWFDGRYESFGWDPTKYEESIQDPNRGIDFADLPQLFFGRVPLLRRRSDRMTKWGTIEERWLALGPFLDIELIAVVYTERNEGRLCWIISARPSDPEEEEVYYDARER